MTLTRYACTFKCSNVLSASRWRFTGRARGRSGNACADSSQRTASSDATRAVGDDGVPVAARALTVNNAMPRRAQSPPSWNP